MRIMPSESLWQLGVCCKVIACPSTTTVAGVPPPNADVTSLSPPVIVSRNAKKAMTHAAMTMTTRRAKMPKMPSPRKLRLLGGAYDEDGDPSGGASPDPRVGPTPAGSSHGCGAGGAGGGWGGRSGSMARLRTRMGDSYPHHNVGQ